MKSSEDNAGSVEKRSDDRDELTSLPGLRTWRQVYLFVFGCFILWVVLLLALTVHYS
jgi:hypothetical protein